MQNRKGENRRGRGKSLREVEKQMVKDSGDAGRILVKA